MVKKCNLISFWLFYLIVNPLFSQQIKFEIDNNNVKIGQNIELKIEYDINGSLEIMTPDEFEFGGSERSMMQQSMGAGGMLNLNMVYYRNGYFTKEGSFVIGPVIIKKGKTQYKSNTIEVKVSLDGNEADIEKHKKEDKDNLAGLDKLIRRRNFVGQLDVKKKSVYQGEPLLIQSRIIAKVYPENLTGYRPYSTKGSVESYALGSMEDIDYDRINYQGSELLSFSFDKKVLFFKNEGQYKIDPYQINVEYGGFFSKTIQSNKADITVKPLPKNKPKDFNGIVGKVKIQESIPEIINTKGKVYTFSISLEGYGNIHESAVPELMLSDGWEKASEPKYSSKYTFNEHGASGNITYEYFIRSLSENPSNIPPLSLSYFDTEQERFIQLKSKSIYNGNLSVEEKLVQDETPKDIDKKKSNPESDKQIVSNFQKQDEEKSPYTSPIIWITLTSILAMAIIVGVFARPKINSFGLPKRKKKLKSSDITKCFSLAVKNIQNEEFESGISMLEQSIFMSIAFRLRGEYSKNNHNELLHELRHNNEFNSVLPSIEIFLKESQNYRYGIQQKEEVPLELVRNTEFILKEFKIQ